MLHLSSGNIIAFWKMPEMQLKNYEQTLSEISEARIKQDKKSELSKGFNDLKGMASIGNAGLLHSDFPAQATGEKRDHVSMVESSCLPTVDC